ncbi:hypothetical protein HYW18_01470 [Candidatus Uhrbacteria bacterium]|nr:hypothetical protein [Candidatus Uhrbacteria bacterium]
MPGVFLSTERYESSAFREARGRPSPALKKFIWRGAVMVWDDRRQMFVCCRGLPEAIEMCNRVEAKMDNVEMPTIEFGLSELALFWSDALLAESARRERDAVYAKRVAGLLDLLRAVQGPRAARARELMGDAVFAHDRTERRNWSANLARLSASAEHLGVRREEIEAVHEWLDPRRAVLLAKRHALLGFLDALRRQVNDWMTLLSRHWGDSETLRSLYEQMDAASRDLLAVYPRPVEHLTQHMARDLQEMIGLAESSQDPRPPKELVARYQAQVVGISIQHFGLMQLASLRTLVGTIEVRRLPDACIPWAELRHGVHDARQWARGLWWERKALRRRSTIPGLVGCMEDAARACRVRRIKDLHAALRLAAQHI